MEKEEERARQKATENFQRRNLSAQQERSCEVHVG